MRIRTFLEMNVPLWTFSISQIISEKIEKVQRTAIYIILGKEAHSDYHRNLALLDLLPLQKRRENIVNKFALTTFRNPAHKTMFQVAEKNTRTGKHILVPAAKKVRYEKSSVPSLARILNKNLFSHA